MTRVVSTANVHAADYASYSTAHHGPSGTRYAVGPGWQSLRHNAMTEPTAEGIVEEALPNTLFRVRLSDDSLVLAYLAGKMRLHRIKVLVGDKVVLQLDPYGGRARIVRRI